MVLRSCVTNCMKKPQHKPFLNVVWKRKQNIITIHWNGISVNRCNTEWSHESTSYFYRFYQKHGNIGHCIFSETSSFLQADGATRQRIIVVSMLKILFIWLILGSVPCCWKIDSVVENLNILSVDLNGTMPGLVFYFFHDQKGLGRYPGWLQSILTLSF